MRMTTDNRGGKDTVIGGLGRNVFEPWEFLKFIVNFKDVSLRSNGFYQL